LDLKFFILNFNYINFILVVILF